MSSIYTAGCQLGRANGAVGQLICTDASVRQNVRAADFFRQMSQRNLAFADMPALHSGFRQMAAVNAARRQMAGSYGSIRQFGAADTAVRQQLGSQRLLGQML
ncbi:hypothetical protein D3C74_438860 [compost metagenome]